jgi:hypothetical protein
MTRIDADALVAASPAAIWRLITDHERWRDWCAAGESALRLEGVRLLDGGVSEIGALRRCTATVAYPVFASLAGRRRWVWLERISDVRAPWSIEFEACGARRVFRRWRLRLTLIAQPDGQTRIHARITYAASGPLVWLAGLLFVRRAATACLEHTLDNLARVFASPVEFESLAPRGEPAIAAPEAAA